MSVEVCEPPKGRKYPFFSCQYWCPYQPGPMYCAEACYALDGFDLSGKDYP